MLGEQRRAYSTGSMGATRSISISVLMNAYRPFLGRLQFRRAQ